MESTMTQSSFSVNVYCIEYTMFGVVIKFLCTCHTRSVAEQIIKNQMFYFID